MDNRFISDYLLYKVSLEQSISIRISSSNISRGTIRPKRRELEIRGKITNPPVRGTEILSSSVYREFETSARLYRYFRISRIRRNSVGKEGKEWNPLVARVTGERKKEKKKNQRNSDSRNTWGACMHACMHAHPRRDVTFRETNTCSETQFP